jgi:hypothetical protein
MTKAEKYEDIVDHLKASFWALRKLRNSRLDSPLDKIEQAIQELDTIPKDDAYWEDFG